MEDELKTHCPNCTFVNVNTMQKCTNCNTTLRKRHRSHENDENDENYSEDEVNYSDCIQPTTNNNNTNSLDNINTSNNGTMKQNTRSSSSYLPNTHGQTRPRMISTLFSTAAGAPVMVSEASLQKAKLKYGSNNNEEENYSDNISNNNSNNNNSNSIYTKSTNSTLMHNKQSEREHETQHLDNNYNFLTKSHTLVNENKETKEQTKQLNNLVESSYEEQEEGQQHKEKNTKQSSAQEQLEEEESELYKESQEETEKQETDTKCKSRVSAEERSPLKEKNANVKDVSQLTTDYTVTSNIISTGSSNNTVIITPASNLLQPARIGLRAVARRGFVPPQRIKEAVVPENQNEKPIISGTNAHLESGEMTENLEQHELKELQDKLDRPPSLAITLAFEMKCLPEQPSCNEGKEKELIPSTSKPTSSLVAIHNSLLSKPQVKISKLSAIGFDYHSLQSEPTRDIPTISAIMSGEFAFSTILCSDAFRTVCGLTPTEVHLNAKHWQHMLITLGASEAHVPLDWITHIVRSSMIEVRSLAAMTRSFLCKHATQTSSNVLAEQANNAVSCQSTSSIASTAFTPNLESSSTPHLFFAPTTVALYMCEKYNTEVVQGHYSALREIVEGDVPSASLMILQLTEVCSDRSAPHTRVVRLCDGLYHLKVNFDLPLSNLLREKVLNVGQKMAICGARYLLPQPTTPLECLEKLVLAVNYNCVRAVSMQSPLGLCHCQPAPLSIHLVHPNGGMVCALQGMVIRTLPVFYISHEVGTRHCNGNEINTSNNNSNSNTVETAASLSVVTHKVVRNAYAQQREFALLSSQIRKHYHTDNSINVHQQQYNNSNGINGCNEHSNDNKIVTFNNKDRNIKCVDAASANIPVIKVSCVRSVVIANDGVEALIQQWHDWDVSKMSTEEFLHWCDSACEYGNDGMNFVGESGRVSNGNSTNDVTATNKNICKYNYGTDEGQTPHEGSEIVIYALKPSKSQMACAPFAHAKLFYSARHLHFTQVQHIYHYQREFVNCFSNATHYKMGSVVDVVGLFVGTVQLLHGTFILLLMENDTYVLLQVPLPEQYRVLSFAIPSKLNVPIAICNATFVCYEDKIAGSDCTRVFANEFTLLLSEQQCKATYVHTALKRAAELVELINSKPHKYNSRVANIWESLEEVNNPHSNSITEKAFSNSVDVSKMSKEETGSTTAEIKNTKTKFNNDDDNDNVLIDKSTCLVNAVVMSPTAITDLSEENAWDEFVGNNIIGTGNQNVNSSWNKFEDNSTIRQSRRVFSPTARVPYYMRHDKKELINGSLNNKDGDNSSSSYRKTNGVKLISREKELSMTIPPYAASVAKETSSSPTTNIMTTTTAGRRSEEHKESSRNCDAYHYYGNIIDFTYVYADVAGAELLEKGNTQLRSVCFLRGESVNSTNVLDSNFQSIINAQGHNNIHSASHNDVFVNGINNNYDANCTANGNVNSLNSINDDVSKHNTNMLISSFYVTWQYSKEPTECKRAKILHSSLLHTMLESVIPLRKLCSLASDARETNLALERSEVIAQWTRDKLHSPETNGGDGGVSDMSRSEQHNEWWRFFTTSCVVDNNSSNSSVNIQEALAQKRLCWLLTEWQTAMQLLRQALRRTLYKFTIACHDVTDEQKECEFNNCNNDNDENNTKEAECHVINAYFISDHCDVRSLFDSNDKSK